MKPHALIQLACAICLSTTLLAEDARVLTYLRPIQEIELSSSESGIISAVFVRPGAQVGRGQELLKLNSSVIEAQLAQAQAQAAHQGQIKAAEAEYQMAKQRLEIIQTLKDSGSTNDAERDKAAATLAVAEGQLQAAREQRDALRLEAATIKAQLEERTVRSPIEGLVTEVTRDVGESIASRNPDTPDYLAKVVDLSQLISRVHIPANLTSGLKLGQTLQLKLDDSAGTKATGKIQFISPTVDAATGLAEVHLIFDNDDGHLRSGLPGTLLIPKN